MQVTKSRAFWPYQIRRLLDSGDWTVDELAKALKNTPERIRQYVSGRAIPEPITQLDLLRMLTIYEKRCVREGRDPHPRVSENHVEKPERGVFEDVNVPGGMRVFKVVSSRPGEVGIVIWPDAWVTPQFVANLKRGLDLRDPEQQLKAI